MTKEEALEKSNRKLYLGLVFIFMDAQRIPSPPMGHFKEQAEYYICKAEEIMKKVTQ